MRIANTGYAQQLNSQRYEKQDYTIYKNCLFAMLPKGQNEIGFIKSKKKNYWTFLRSGQPG